MKYEVEIIARYDTDDAKDERDALKLSIVHLMNEILLWEKGKIMAQEAWNISVKEVE